MRILIITLSFGLSACGGSDITSQQGPIDPIPTPETVGAAQANYASVSLEETSEVVFSNLTAIEAALNGAQVVMDQHGHLIGVAPEDASLPVIASFSGDAVNASIIDGDQFYNFDRGRVTAEFGVQSAITLNQFQGTMGIGPTSNDVTDSDILIKWSGFSACDGTHICGGDIAVHVDDLVNTDLSDHTQSSAVASLFGQSGDEIAGMIFVDDPNRLTIMADFNAVKDN